MKSSFVHQLGDAYRKAVSVFGPVETKSQFEAKGTLTVAEFIEAGDALVFKFPTWQWTGARDKKLEKEYLPNDKQFLVTRHVPCEQRVADLDRGVGVEVSAGAGSEGECWTLTGRDDRKSESSEGKISQAPILTLVEDYRGGKDDGLSRLDRELLGERGEEVVVRRVAEDEEDRASHMRSYDLSITWDKFYQTPRLWLRGFSASGEPLGERGVREDVLGEYASKTVTMEPHPATGELTASIHPCRHAEMMKRVIDTWKEKNLPVRPDLSLFVFLKFISGVVPTINYDFTFDLEMNS